MAADPRAFNGSTLTFKSTPVAKLIGMQYRSNGTVIDVTEPDDTTKLYEVGQPENEMTATVKRMPLVAIGDNGALSVVWHDGSTTAFTATWTVTAIGGGGSQDAPISGDITFRRTTLKA